MRQRRIAEWMDDPDLPSAEHEKALTGLARLNAISGAARQMWREMAHFGQKAPGRPLRILELASGDGDMASQWIETATRVGLDCHWTLSDYNPRTVDYLAKRFATYQGQVEARLLDARADRFGSYDLVVCNLFLHHFDTDQVAKILDAMTTSARLGVVIGDLARGWFNLIMVWTACQLLSRSRVVHHDGPASVRAAYTPNEIERLAHQAGMTGVVVRTGFPCRWILRWERPNPC